MFRTPENPAGRSDTTLLMVGEGARESLSGTGVGASISRSWKLYERQDRDSRHERTGGRRLVLTAPSVEHSLQLEDLSGVHACISQVLDDVCSSQPLK